jgi:hypothetical protein
MRLRRVLSWLNHRAAAPIALSRRAPVSLRLEELETRQVPTVFANQTYVATLYQGLLGRPVDGSGLAYWSAALNTGTSRAQVAQDILSSDEFLGREVQLFYKTLLGRDADDAGLASWVGQLQSGASAEQVKAGIIGSDEFLAHAGGTAQGFLNALYHDELGRSVDSAGASFWGTTLAGGAARSDVAFQVMGSLEGEQVKVSSLYQEVLGRQPDAAGGSYWVTALRNGASDETAIAGVVGSDEFFLQMSAAIASNPTDPNSVATQFITGANKFGETLPGLEQINRNIATLQIVFVAPPTGGSTASDSSNDNNQTCDTGNNTAIITALGDCTTTTTDTGDCTTTTTDTDSSSSCFDTTSVDNSTDDSGSCDTGAFSDNGGSDCGNGFDSSDF